MVVAARYVNRELLQVLLAVTAVLLFVTIGARFISYLQDAALGKYAPESILMILWYRLPGFLQLLLPFGWFLAILLTLGRLHAEQEFEVLRSGGVGPVHVLRWLSFSTILVSVTVGYFSLVLAPENDRRLTEFIRSQQANAEFNVVSPGIFHTYQGGRRITYADSLSEDGQTLEDVFMAELKTEADPITMRAARGGQQTDPATGVRYLVLEDGHRYEGSPGRPDYQVVSFRRLIQRLEDGPPVTRVGIEAESTTTLRQRTDSEARAELHFRFALPLVVLISTLVGVAVARTRPREGRFARLIPGLGMFVAYYAAIVFNRNAISDGQIPPEFGMWLTHVFFLVTGVIWLRSSSMPARS